MNSTPLIGITGATGNIGSRVAELLKEAGARLRLLVRDPARLTPGLADDAEVRKATYSDSEATREALKGVEVLLMVSAKEAPDRADEHRALVDAAAAAGVGHIVYTSFVGAAPAAIFTHARDHWHTEEHIKHSGMAWTFLRDSFYLDFFADLVDSGEVRGPAGDGRCGAVAREDVARCAATILPQPASHAGATYDLTGPEALTMAEVARIGSEVTGHPIAYVDESMEEAYESRKGDGAPAWEVDAWVSTYTAIAVGELDVLSDTVETLTGRKPLGLADVLASRE